MPLPFIFFSYSNFSLTRPVGAWWALRRLLTMPLSATAVQAILTGETTGAEGQLGQFSDNVLRDCKVVSCEPQRLVVTLPVTARITNSSANLHGGASCTLVDTLSAMTAS